MLGSWFSSKSSDNVNKDIDPLRSPIDAAHAEDTSYPDSALPPTHPTGFSSPHDDVLAELYGLRPNVDASPHFNTAVAPTAPKDDGKRNSNATAASGSHPRNVASSKQSRQELRDPFSGALLGTLVPFEQEEDDVGIDAKEKELWSHLSKILELQNELAHMHVEMEGVGAKEGEGRRKGMPGTRRNWGEGDGDGREEEDEEAKENKAREEEFAALASKFSGRRAAIDGVMNKLGELSDSLSAFHALQTPHLNFSPRNSANTNTDNKNTDDTPAQQPGSKSPNEPHSPTLDGDVCADPKISTFPDQDFKSPPNQPPIVPVISVQDSPRLVDSQTQTSVAIPRPVAE